MPEQVCWCLLFANVNVVIDVLTYMWSYVLKIWSMPPSPPVSRHPWSQSITQQPHVDFMSKEPLSHFSGYSSCCGAAFLKISLTSPLCCLPKSAGSPIVSPSPRLPGSVQSCISQYILHEIISFFLPHSEPVSHVPYFHLLSSFLKMQYSECYMHEFGDRLPALNPSTNIY